MKCEACDREVEKLVWHHWFDSVGREYGKNVCAVCNSVLATPMDSENNHVLPEWEVQRLLCLKRRYQKVLRFVCPLFFTYTPAQLASLRVITACIQGDTLWEEMHLQRRRDQGEILKVLRAKFRGVFEDVKACLSPDYLEMREWVFIPGGFGKAFPHLPKVDVVSGANLVMAKSFLSYELPSKSLPRGVYPNYEHWREGLCQEVDKAAHFLENYTIPEGFPDLDEVRGPPHPLSYRGRKNREEQRVREYMKDNPDVTTIIAEKYGLGGTK